MKLQTKDLTGAALDWCVAKCEESDAMCFVVGCRLPPGGVYVGGGVESAVFVHDYTPSTDWAQGGPLLQAYDLNIHPITGRGWCSGVRNGGAAFEYCGPTPLVAICRALVGVKFGPEIDVPAELCGEVGK